MQSRLGVIHMLASGVIASWCCWACSPEKVPAASLKSDTSECLPGIEFACTCPGGAAGKALCGSNAMFAPCNCSAAPAAGAAPAANGGNIGAPVGTGTAAIGGTAGALSRPGGTAGVGVTQGAAGSAASGVMGAGCAPGETCKTSGAGAFKFCSADPAASLPPPCTAANQACGATGTGTCLDATSAGFAGSLFCVHTGC